MSIYSNTKAELYRLGRIDVDNFPKGELYQCVDLVKYYMRKFGVPYGSYGNAIAYANPKPAILKKFHKLSGSAQPQQGDIAVLTPNHIGIVDSVSGSNIVMLEQNGWNGNGNGLGGNAVRTRTIPRSRIAALLRPTATVDAPQPVYYTVRKGDTLSKIAASYSTTWQKLQQLNGIPNANKIYPGQRVRVK